MEFPGASFLIQDALFASNPVEEIDAPLRTVTEALRSIKRDTKSKGDLSELIVAVALTRAGYAVSKPLGENQRYDLIADDGERLHRVQVKTGRVRDGVVKSTAAARTVTDGRKLGNATVYWADRIAGGVLPRKREGVCCPGSGLNAHPNPASPCYTPEQHDEDDPVGFQIRAAVAQW